MKESRKVKERIFYSLILASIFSTNLQIILNVTFITVLRFQVSRLDEAINAYRSALHLKADHPHAYNNLGNAMIEKGYIKEAIHCYVTAKFSAAHCNLGSVFKEQGQFPCSIVEDNVNTYNMR